MDKARPFSTLLMANIGTVAAKIPASLLHSKQMVRLPDPSKTRCPAHAASLPSGNIDQEQKLIWLAKGYQPLPECDLGTLGIRSFKILAKFAQNAVEFCKPSFVRPCQSHLNKTSRAGKDA
jgi:hypothetical protein